MAAPKSSHGGLKTNPGAQGHSTANYQFVQDKFLRKRLSINDKCATAPSIFLSPLGLGTNIGNKKELT
jgi:hypothetical protein